VRVFVSYAAEQRDLAERLAMGLRNDGHSVFFDRESLPPGESFDDRIRAAIHGSRLFVFLVSEASLQRGAYAESELNMAQQRWPNPSGNVLPILTGDVAIDRLPPYLRAVSVLETKGDLVAEALDAVARLSRDRRIRFAKRFAAPSITLVVAAVAAWGWFALHRGLSIQDIHVTPIAEKGPDGAAQFRFDITLRNRGSDAVTVVGVAPYAKSDQARFGGTSFEWLNLNPREEAKASVVTTLQRQTESTSFGWRICWEYVKTEDRYYELESGKANVDMFMARYRREDCSSWRAWRTQN
jgi:hypothetical protein